MFDIYKRLELNFLGESWEGCYITFSALTVRESKEVGAWAELDDDKAVDAMVELLKKKFKEGKAISNEKQVEIKKDNIEDLSVEVLVKSVEILTGDVSQKKS